MKKVTIEKVENGFLVTDENGNIWVATTMTGYSGISLIEVLRSAFEDKKDD